MKEQSTAVCIFKSVAAVAMGTAAGIAITIATDFALHAVKVFPAWDQRVPDALLLLATGYRTVYSVGASYLIARLAPNRPMAHALAGGVLGLLANGAGMVATWNAGPQYEAHWYPIALTVLALPCAWAGGFVRERQVQAAGSEQVGTRR